MRRNDEPSTEEIAFKKLYELGGRLLAASNATAFRTTITANADWTSGPDVRAGESYPLEITSSTTYMMGQPRHEVVLLMTDRLGLETPLNEGHMLFLDGLDADKLIEQVNADVPNRRRMRLEKVVTSLVKASGEDVTGLKVGDVVTQREALEGDLVDDEYTYIIIHVLSKAEQLLYWKAQQGQSPLHQYIMMGTRGGLENSSRICLPGSGVDLVKIGTLADFDLELPEGNWLENILPVGPGFNALLGGPVAAPKIS